MDHCHTVAIMKLLTKAEAQASKEAIYVCNTMRRHSEESSLCMYLEGQAACAGKRV